MLYQVALSLALSQIEVPFGEYPYWKDFEAGSWVKRNGKAMLASKTVEFETTLKLVEVTKEKLIIEVTTKYLGEGYEKNPASVKREYTAAKKDSPKIDKEGEEELQVGGKKIKSHWVEFVAPKRKTRVKIWFGKDVPGGMIKMSAEDGMIYLEAMNWERK